MLKIFNIILTIVYFLLVNCAGTPVFIYSLAMSVMFYDDPTQTTTSQIVLIIPSLIVYIILHYVGFKSIRSMNKKIFKFNISINDTIYVWISSLASVILIYLVNAMFD